MSGGEFLSTSGRTVSDEPQNSPPLITIDAPGAGQVKTRVRLSRESTMEAGSRDIILMLTKVPQPREDVTRLFVTPTALLSLSMGPIICRASFP